MPDHLHVVVEGFDDTSNLPRFVRLAKQQTAYHFKRVTGERLWQDSYFDRTLRRDDDLGAMIRYVLDNPVRAGLVSTPMEYPHWGSQVTSRAGLLEFAGDCPRV